MTTPSSITRALEAAGIKSDVSPDRVARMVEDTAEANGVAPERVAQSPALIEQVVHRLTIQESWFFRDGRQLAVVLGRVLALFPPPIRVWCAGCANGQEAWTVAMLLAESGVDEWRVTATDLSARAVATAKAGVYGGGQLRGLPAAQHERHLVRVDREQWSISEALRARVEFVQHNVARQAPPVPPGSGHMVLCRNVLIYLRDDAVQSALSSVERALAPGGMLLVGGAESLWGLTESLETVRLDGAFAYRKPGGPALDSPPSPPGAPPVQVDLRAPLPDPAALIAGAREAAARGDHEAAAKAFRQAAYLDPDAAEAHTGLSIALDALGDGRAAARARAAAKAARQRPKERGRSW